MTTPESEPTTSAAASVNGVQNQSVQAKAFRKCVGDLNPNNIGQLKVISSVIFPVRYSEKFYKDALKAGEFAKLALFNDAAVGGVVCIEEPAGNDKSATKLYMATLGVLAAYRKLGLGTMLLDHIIEECKKRKQKITEIYLHVQSSNEEAIQFYTKRGFEVQSSVEGYYKQGSDPNAIILVRKLSVQ
ncbi:acyl-CoA N-acyltransferase [Gaertneriomyces semiglobifer]|nr:acyl-CoA N-acyltransferase [Gaertneriomyces semiglobifer]